MKDLTFNDTFEKRFWAKVEKTDTCWNWTAYRVGKGYGYIGANGRSGNMISAHRASWVLHFGTIPGKLFVLHTCDNPRCVRPDHLELGTQQKNMTQKMDRGRAASRKAFLQIEVDLLRKVVDNGTTKVEVCRRTGIDSSTLYRLLNMDYVGRAQITPELFQEEKI